MPGKTKTELNICIIGAGFSGLCAAIQLKQKLGIDSFTIFEVNEDIGGTWLVNKYPGCACDVHSHLYSLSFEQNPDWPKKYSGQGEIWKYLKKVTEKHLLYPKIKFGHQVKTLVWDEMINKWRVSVVDKNAEDGGLQNLIFDIVINAPGSVRGAHYPEEFKSFRGPTIHSAEWDSSINLKDKVVAVIGSGSSAVQVIPQVAEKAKELHVYQRKPAWIGPQDQFDFSATTKFIFTYFPFIMWIFRFFIYLAWEIMYPAFRTDSWMNKHASKKAMKYLREQVKDEKLVEDLTPNYAITCKRICASDIYYSTFNKPHVKLHRSPIVKASENSLRTENGVETKIDVLVLATGYRTQEYFSPMQISGRKGENIVQKWMNDKPTAYYGIICHAAPNHFMLLGPNTLLGNNSVVYMMECQVNFIVKVIGKMMETDSTFVSVKESAEKEYMENLWKCMKKTTWSSGNCGSWYSNAKGEITMIYPYPCSTYWWKTRNVKFSKFDFS